MPHRLSTELAKSFQGNQKIFQQFYAHPEYLNTTVTMVEAMADIFKKGHKIMVCGNGGSACQATHFAEELTGRYRKDRKALPALSLTEAAHITCVGNDYGFEYIFSRAVDAYAQKGDGLLLLSTSGNSLNLIKAAEMAKARGVTTFALLGKGGGKLLKMCEHELIAPGTNSDEVQNIHMVLVHALIEGVERLLFPENY